MKEDKKGERVIKIQNDGDKENLRRKARKIYWKKMLSPREKMLIENKVFKLERVRMTSREHTPKIKEAEFLR